MAKETTTRGDTTGDGVAMMPATKDQEQLRGSIDQWLSAVADIEIMSDEDNQRAADALNLAKDLEKEADRIYGPVKSALNRAKADVMAAQKRELAPVAAAKSEIAKKMVAYDDMKMAMRREREERERKRREEERKAMEAEAEAARKKQAEAARDMGMPKVAENIENRPVEIAPFPKADPPQEKVQRPEGITFRESHTGKVTNMAAFAGWCVTTGRVGFLTAVQSKVNELARHLKKDDAVDAVPGFEIVTTKTPVRR